MDLLGGARIHRGPLDPDLRAEDRDLVQVLPVGLDPFQTLLDAKRDADELSPLLDGPDDPRRVVDRVPAEDEAVRTGVRERPDPGERVGRHQVDLEGTGGVLADRRDQIWEEQEGGDVMAIGDVEMKPLGVWFDPADLRCEARQVGGPQGRRAFQHGDARCKVW
jgi:hypothetical protein